LFFTDKPLSFSHLHVKNVTKKGEAL